MRELRMHIGTQRRRLTRSLAGLGLMLLTATGCDCDGTSPGSSDPSTISTRSDGGSPVLPPNEDAGSIEDGGSQSCTLQQQCADTCCRDGEECVEDRCLALCPGTRCGTENDLCCGGNALCLGQACVVPSGLCSATEDCAIDEICEPTVAQCVPRSSVEVCEYRPPVGQFSPTKNCQWTPNPGDPEPTRDAVEAAPIVINLSDDNGDGLTNTDDIPDIVFPSHDYDQQGCCSNPSTIRIVSGECNPDGTMRTLGSISTPATESSQGLAAGDLDNDGVPEIVGITKSGGAIAQGTVAWRRLSSDAAQWEVLWHNEEYPNATHSRGGAIVSLADLDGDGNPEVIVGNVVLNGQTGVLKWDGNETSNGTGGVGNNAFLGPTSAVGDIDNDGNQEVLAGNTLYDHDGSVLWTYTYTSEASICQGALPCDGFAAMANFDDDPYGEAVIVRRGEVFILEHTGELLWKREVFWEDCTRNGRANEAGPPTIADFDGDGQPEIGTAGADFYVVMDLECDPADPSAPIPDKCQDRGVLWASANQDCSSRATASSVFDFEGDGKAEMVYADEQSFKIHDGSNGAVLYQDTQHSSNTRIEMPIIVDVDNDGNAEAVVPAPRTPNRGIIVWGDDSDNWVRTRRIWNQHAYSVTNVSEDGQIPTQPETNWSNERLNNFRQQIQPGGVFDASDLRVVDIGLGAAGCFVSVDSGIQVVVTNEGALGQSPGVPVDIYLVHAGERTLHERVFTQTRLLPGQSETLFSSWTVPPAWPNDGFEIEAIIDPQEQVNECEEGNNRWVEDQSTLVDGLPELAFESFEPVGSCGASGLVELEITMRNEGSGEIPSGIPIVIQLDAGNGPMEAGEVRTTRVLGAGEREMLLFSWTTDMGFYGSILEATAAIDPNRTLFQCEELREAQTTVSCVPSG